MEYCVLWRGITLLAVSCNITTMSKHSAAARLFLDAESELGDTCHIMITTGRI